MADFIKKLEENSKCYADNTAIVSAEYINGITYAELWEYSGRVYAWLKQNHIGREDMVLIYLPRSAEILVSMIGVIRAGAAFVIAETETPKDRVKFIKKDCSCKIVIDSFNYREMMKMPSSDGYEATGSHDAAFAVYTSGSTGNPKGILHEYGKYEQVIKSAVNLYGDFPAGSNTAFSSPFNFVTALIHPISSLYYGLCVHIVPYSVVKNTGRMEDYLIEHKIVCTMLPPSLFRMFRKRSPYLIRVCVGSEPCNGIYCDSPKIINRYASSESVFQIAEFEIDRPYDITPAGKNNIGIDPFIADDNGNRLPAGETGEICFFDEFTRGYINLEEKTREVFKNKICHTGDLGYINENGLLVVLGRKDDMMKINGNRVEPGEIETVISGTLGLNNVIVKGFDSNGSITICAYMLYEEVKNKGLLSNNGELIYSSAQMKEKISDTLPYYMIPAYYIIIDEFPRSSNGKILRKELKAPDTYQFRSCYEKPSNDKETYFCRLFEQTLRLENVGRNDDFFLLGGNSLSAIDMVGKSDSVSLSVEEIYKYRTPCKLAEKCLCSEKTNENMSEDIPGTPLEILPVQRDVIKLDADMPMSTMWNLPFLLHMKKGTDPGRLAKAIDKVFSAHPSLWMVFYKDNKSHIYQCCEKSRMKDIDIISLSQSEFMELRNKLIRPFDIYESLLHRESIYLADNEVYLFMDFHHLIVDGVSLKLLFSQISAVYNDFDYVIPKDYYLNICKEHYETIRKESYVNTIKLYKSKYESFISSGPVAFLLKPDYKSVTRKKGTLVFEISKDKKAIEGSEFRKSFTENEFFLSGLALALMKYEHTNQSIIQWVYEGRNTHRIQSSCGLLFRYLPVFLSVYEASTLSQCFENVKKQVEFGISNYECSLDDAIGAGIEDMVFFLYQKNIMNLASIPLVEERMMIDPPYPVIDCCLEICLIDNDEDNNYKCMIQYSADHYRQETMKRFFKLYNDILSKLAEVKDLDSIKTDSL